MIVRLEVVRFIHCQQIASLNVTGYHNAVKQLYTILPFTSCHTCVSSSKTFTIFSYPSTTSGPQCNMVISNGFSSCIVLGLRPTTELTRRSIGLAGVGSVVFMSHVILVARKTQFSGMKRTKPLIERS